MSTATAAPIALSYVDEGHGEPVLLLHGLGSRAADWQLQMPEFARSYRVIAPDLRGHGTSAKPAGPYSVAMMAADVEALLRRLELGPVHIVGLSMGGMIAFQFAVDKPECVRSMVIANSTPDMVPRTMRQRLQVAQRLTLARLTQPRQSGKFLSQRLFPKPEQEPLREKFVAEWSENDKDAYVAAMKALIGWSVLDRLQNIHCPVLVISGDRDYLPLDAKRTYTAMMPGARLEIVEDSGHATPIDQTEQFNRLVLAFLDEVSESAGASHNP